MQQKRELEEKLESAQQTIDEAKEEFEKKKKALKEAKTKLEEATATVEASEKELKEWEEANKGKVKKLSAKEIAEIGKKEIFLQENQFEGEAAEKAAELAVRLDIAAASEREATLRNLEFLEGVAADDTSRGKTVNTIKNTLSLGLMNGIENFSAPMRGENLIKSVAKELHKEGKLKINCNQRDLAKLDLSEDQLVLLYGVCQHALKHEKLSLGDRVALSRLSGNAKRLIAKARVGTDREGAAIESVRLSDYQKLAKEAKHDDKHGEKHGDGHGEGGHKASKFDRYVAGGQIIYNKGIGRLVGFLGGGGGGHGSHKEHH
jgi:hypothetical protein